MTSVYGKFEAVRELYKTATGSVWSARARDSRETTDCIKLVQLDEMMLEHRDTSVAESLLVSAAIQQTMANKSEFWAPVYELGSDGTNAFFVSRLYPRTLQTLIETEVKLSSAELQMIMLAIVDGLMDLETAYHRQHGNLKPANVMIAAKAHLSPGGILLADPDSVADNLPSMTRAPDTKAMGQILYALVTHKPYTGARLPLPASPAWKQLGSTGKDWRALCERLLDTFSRQGMPTLETLRMRIGEIRPTRRPFPRSAFAAILLAAAAAAGYQERSQLAEGWDHGRVAATSLIGKFVHSTATTTAAKAPTTNPSRSHAPTTLPANGTAILAAFSPKVAPPQPAMPKENPAIALIKSASAPELHSVAAQNEFLRDRDAFLAKRMASRSTNTVEWDGIEKAIEDLDLRYPQPEPTVSWPTPLEPQLIRRRDAELVRAVDAIFNHDNADPSSYVAELTDAGQTSDAANAAHIALAASDVIAADAAVKDFSVKLDALESIDVNASATFNPMQPEFRSFIDAKTATDRAGLLIACANDSLPLSTRIRSWLRLSKAAASNWPADLPTLAADRAQGDRLSDLSKNAPATQTLIAAEQQARLDGFFASLRDDGSVRDAASQAATASLTSLVPLYPQWFQYDAMLAKFQQAPADISHDQAVAFLDLADKMHAENIAQLRSAFAAVTQPARTLGTVGPAGAGWKLAPGSDADHRTYMLGSESIEFLRVRQPGSEGSPGVNCYLSTTEVPVSLLQALLDKSHAAQLQAAQTLNDHSAPAEPTLQIWSFTPDGIQLDKQDYRARFLLAPTVHLPAQALTPEMAMYVARLVGCRLPTSDEWRGALAQVTQPNADGYQWAFAMRDWKLRDSDFTAAINHAGNSRPPQFWPNDGIFRDLGRPTVGSGAQDSRIWSSANLATLAGQISPVPNVNQPDGEQSLPMAPGHLGFREVDDGAHYTGVFHDLIGNAAEFVLDIPTADSEKLDASDAGHAAEQIKNWFTPERQARLAVIGGSALSSPDLDPRTRYPLPKDPSIRAFSDVGFRLAFSDPKAVTTVDPAKLRTIALRNTAYITAGSPTTNPTAAQQ